MFRTTKSTNSRYFAFQRFKNNGAITDHRIPIAASMTESGATVVTLCCLWRKRHFDASVVNVRPKILALKEHSYFKI